MLINTVILFLRDLLPLFILFAYCQVIFPTIMFTIKHKIYSVLICLLITFLYWCSAEHISEMFDGAGIEILSIALLLTSYFGLMLVSCFSNNKNNHYITTKRLMIMLGIICFSVIKLSEFTLFFNVYTSNANNWLNLAVGVVIGLGICFSFYILFSYFLKELISKSHQKIVFIFWFLFLAGQVNHIILFLAQIDFISLNRTVVNLSAYLADSSEYGHILNALIGYESSPSQMHINLYSLTLVLPIVIYFTKPLMFKITHSKGGENE